MEMSMGVLHPVPAAERPDLLAPPVAAALGGLGGQDGVGVAEIDPELADTAAFCERYQVSPAESANCVVLATSRADVNGLARRRLDVRKASFAATELAVAETGMEYGGITPVGLPPGWPVLIDAAVAAAPRVVIGSGVRRSKLTLPGAVLAGLPGAEVLDGLGR
jgi:prolyl-tRNA editing enzyme YbaK/EbsC (Cys-tRNA(Pro) deacylase)